MGLRRRRNRRDRPPRDDFTQPGEYTISLRIHSDKKKSHERKIRITVPANYSVADSE